MKAASPSARNENLAYVARELGAAVWRHGVAKKRSKVAKSIVSDEAAK